MLNLQYIAKKKGGRSTNLGRGITKHKKTTRGKKIFEQGSSEA
jgi:hypothetical protein